jgi:hypothetical protein
MDILKKIYAPLIISVIGLVFVLYGFANTQPPLFMLGAFAFLVAGVIAILSSLDIFSKMIRTVILIGLAVVSLGLTWLDYKAIKDPLDFQKEKNFKYAYVIQNLKDLRQAQMAYKDRYGKYAGEIGALMKFVKYDSVITVKIDGTVPDGMTREMAIDSGIVTLDTSKIPAGIHIFNEKYLSERKVPFNMDSLPYVPFTQELFKVEASVIERGKVKVPVFLITDTKPFDPYDVLMVGSLTDPSTAGNWGE